MAQLPVGALLRRKDAKRDYVVVSDEIDAMGMFPVLRTDFDRDPVQAKWFPLLDSIDPEIANGAWWKDYDRIA